MDLSTLSGEALGQAMIDLDLIVVDDPRRHRLLTAVARATDALVDRAPFRAAMKAARRRYHETLGTSL